MHYKKGKKIYKKKWKGGSGTEPSRGRPVLTNFTVPHSSYKLSVYWNKKNGYVPQKPPTQGKTIWKKRNMQLLKWNLTYFSHIYACNQLL